MTAREPRAMSALCNKHIGYILNNYWENMLNLTEAGVLNLLRHINPLFSLTVLQAPSELYRDYYGVSSIRDITRRYGSEARTHSIHGAPIPFYKDVNYAILNVSHY